jgi:hypothetical protein
MFTPRNADSTSGLLRVTIVVGTVVFAGLTAIGSARLIFAQAGGPSSQRERADSSGKKEDRDGPTRGAFAHVDYAARGAIDTSGFVTVLPHLPRWGDDAPLEEIARSWTNVGYRRIDAIDHELGDPRTSEPRKLQLLVWKAALLNFEGETNRAYDLLKKTRAWVEKHDDLARIGLYTLIYFEGVTALRRGENDNCVMCRGESSCILPISPAAVHTSADGSRLAIKHFSEYLERFPDDLAVRWLLNLAHMTLGEYPAKVDRRYLITLTPYLNCEFDIGKFRDIGHLVGVDRFNDAGGAVMEDFDGDGMLDLALTDAAPSAHMALYHNMGNGTFKDITQEAGLIKELGGKNLVQTDYNNDGRIDLFISRGAWFPYPMRQSLLRNNGDGTFTDVTREAGFLDPVNSTASRWADYDNDGWIDVLIVCELQTNRLYHNRGDGTFEEVGAKAGVENDSRAYCKGADWIDFDNDDYPDLFVDNMRGTARLYHNNRNGTFTDVTESMGIDGPRDGFSCWAWDYDNDGWLDIFATCFDYTLEDVIKGMVGQPHQRSSNRLFRNVHGSRFEDKTKEAGLDLVFATMGSNFADFDNDGFLDMYLGTGDPDLSMLIPNRMFKNVAGLRFSEITAASGTGHLQKGHGVSCADWDRDGDVDIFIEMGGVTNGDRYHDILFQNPGQGNHSLTVKLVGKKTNRAAIGARIKLVTAGDRPLTLYRHISSGSSWGANPLQQTIGLGKATTVATLEIHWPTSGTTQVFHDIPADRAIEVTEFATEFRPLHWKPIPQPKG